MTELLDDSPDADTERPFGLSRPGVSVVIPAHDAEATLAETLESLLGQTQSHWEAIVVDDGSADGTAELVAGFAGADGRIRLVSQSQAGESQARNIGIGSAVFDWLLFLDADDWLRPTALERFVDAVLADPQVDAVYGGWGRVAPDGALTFTHFWERPADMFAALSRRCVLAVHSCMVRRSLVVELGGFDTSLRTCEDWDLWQRIARKGARFHGVRDVLALYRIRADSASADGFDLISDGLRVITRGHRADPRVTDPHPAYAGGASPEHLTTARIHFACWTGGLVLGRGGDARPLLDAVADERDPELNATVVAEHLLEAVPLGASRGAAAWPELWPEVEPRLDRFLQALERQAAARGVARRVRRALERLAIARSSAARPLTFGATHAIELEVTAPIPDVVPPLATERLECAVELEGTRLGTLGLPVCDGFVPSSVLRDAISAEFHWAILGQFFEHTVYRDLQLERAAHDRLGWAVFLRELWGRRDWPVERFYDLQASEERRPAGRVRARDGWLAVEVSQELPDIELEGREVGIVPTVGGVAIGLVPVSARSGRLSAQRLRATLTTATGTDLCRVAVREALIGSTLAGPISLRERLAGAGARTPGDGAGAAPAPAGFLLAPASDRAVSMARSGLLLGRHATGPIDTSVSRRAALPSAAATELRDAADAAGEPAVENPGARDAPRRVSYLPDLIWRSTHAYAGERAAAGHVAHEDERRAGRSFAFDRHHFERVFAARTDPWHYTNAYEQKKYEQTLALVASEAVDRGLEIGCAEGHFTRLLAPCVGRLTAADISEVALRRAAGRCTGLGNVDFHQLDLLEDPLPGRYELIVCSESLYFMGDRRALEAVALKIAAALEPRGRFVTTHSNLVVDDPERPGFDWDFPFGAQAIGETFAGTGRLRLVEEHRADSYRIQIFRKARRRGRLRRPRAVQVAALPPPPPLPPHVSGDFVSGGRPARVAAAAPVVTHRLPILLYHRIADAGAPLSARYRVTTEAFEQQLRYLRDAGFYHVDLDEWRQAKEFRRPLPGHAVMITFDGGYRDFLTHAWPLLERYGFSAIVFVVTDEVGKTNRWDSVYGESLPLLDWEEIGELGRAGAGIGAHSATHARLTGLCPADVVREAARSRAAICRRLGRPPTAFAYPHGDVDPAVRHLVGACGFVYGLSCRNEPSAHQDDLLDLPRIEVEGSDTLEDFVAKLGAGERFST